MIIELEELGHSNLHELSSLVLKLCEILGILSFPLRT